MIKSNHEQRIFIALCLTTCFQKDCLLAMAVVCVENSWTRPEMTSDGELGKRHLF
jgi:hypothetical protein